MVFAHQALQKPHSVLRYPVHAIVLLFYLFTESRGFLYNVFCAGGVDKENPLNPKDNRENGVMVFFRYVFT